MKKVVFLHHSTGQNIWIGGTNKYVYKVTKRGDVQKAIGDYNKKNKTLYEIEDIFFPKASPYGWNNYPFDYYNIWVKNAGKEPFMEEPTLEILSKNYDVIVFKHCYPVSLITGDSGNPDINSDIKSLENYKMQYNALKQRFYEFPDKKFIVWTPAVNTKSQMSEDEAKRTNEFYNWIINEWDVKGDNIFVWDFYKLETENGLYMQEKYAVGPDDPHPNKEFSSVVATEFAGFVIKVIEAESGI